MRTTTTNPDHEMIFYIRYSSVVQVERATLMSVFAVRTNTNAPTVP